MIVKSSNTNLVTLVLYGKHDYTGISTNQTSETQQANKIWILNCNLCSTDAVQLPSFSTHSSLERSLAAPILHKSQFQAQCNCSRTVRIAAQRCSFTAHKGRLMRYIDS